VVPVLQIVAVVIPINAAASMIGVQWMLPMGLDRALVRVTVLGGLVNVAGMLILGPALGAVGAAITTVAMEAVILIGLLIAASGAGKVRFW
jgi:PST family polysaccharide transporter